MNEILRNIGEAIFLICGSLFMIAFSIYALLALWDEGKKLIKNRNL